MCSGPVLFMVELARTLFVCCAAANDMALLTIKARVNAGSSGFL